jgi:hypothetical protein
MRSRAMFGLFLAIPLIAGCGAGGPKEKSASGATSTPPQVVNASHVVLGLAELGAGWVAVAASTKPVTLEESMKSDPVAIQTVERRAFLSAYQAVFVNARKSGVFSVAFTYRSAIDAKAIANVWNQMNPKKLPGAKLIATPADAPGEGFQLLKAKTGKRGEAVPFYMATWLHGNVIAGVVVFGKGVKPQTLMTLAQKQDAKLLGASVR